MSWAAMLLAMSLLTWPRPRAARIWVDVPGRGPDRAAPGHDDELAVAASLEVLAACLRCGMAVSIAAAGVAGSAPAGLAAPLRRAADLLALGADPARAWAGTENPPDRYVEAFLRLARRSASSGTALAHGVEELAARLRDAAADAAAARAERAAVHIAGPLGLCYLPAFLCLGIVPVVAGLAGDILDSGVL
ncbi:type II secretion system F family protein [Mycobacterium sp. Y57]|uniref:type II secretion system F family protein n=1 Tax=Mycolicibacterium xanthum TaxID=2796469 RepID=UPI001C860AAC|nr:type II secretion system F family protein [Mycolicibacterium xanthum]MBX7431236.1 type II secretion system F family protein [Mycolicibacterium xanthum]